MQRAEALLMLVLIHSHVNAYAFMASGEVPTTGKAVYTVITEVIFILAVSAHSALSSSKALVTLGLVRSEKAMTAAQRCFGLVFGVSGLAAIIAVIRFFAVM